jgi:hypothetical protein
MMIYATSLVLELSDDLEFFENFRIVRSVLQLIG